MKKTNRLFSFGCSFTSYAWPSYACMLGTYFDESENWAFPGLGNRAILERLTEVVVTKKLCKDDTVIIQWTSPFRNDTHKFSEKHWRTKGSIFNFINSNRYDRKWLDEFFDEKSYCFHTLNYIVAAINILENIGCKWFMTSMGAIEKAGSDYNRNDQRNHGEIVKEDINLWDDVDFAEYKQEIVDKHKDKWLPPVGVYAWESKTEGFKFFVNNFKQVFNLSSKKNAIYEDTHPSILQHKEYLDEVLIPKLKLSQKQPEVIKKWIDTVQDDYANCHKQFSVFQKRINQNPKMKDWVIKYRGM